MALSGPISPARRGYSRGNQFGAPIAPSEVVYTGGLTGLNASGQAQRIQTAGTVAFLGLAERGINNSATAAAGDTIVGQLDCYKLAVPGATAANIGAPHHVPSQFHMVRIFNGQFLFVRQSEELGFDLRARRSTQRRLHGL